MPSSASSTTASSTTASSTTQTFDAAVIGLGLIGSAALRHLAAAGSSVVGIGPPEPSPDQHSTGPFASHYDSGRITRRLDAEREWAVLASRAIAQYPVIEESSGRSFHRPAGLLFVRNDDDGIAKQRAVAAELDIPITVEPFSQRTMQFPHLSFPSSWTSIFEPAPAGHIDPRALVDAQLLAAARSGASVIRQPALTLTSMAGGGSLWRVEIDQDTVIEARAIVIATGPYPDDLLERRLAIAVRPEAVILAEVSEDTAQALASMPSIIHLLDHTDLDDVYVVPPVRYPDGRLYVKMGGSQRTATSLESAEEKRAWMTGSDADAQLAVMRDVLSAMLPTTQFSRWSMKPCLISDTESGLPYVDQIDDGLVVAIGGNGHAAKSSDAIGAMAAGLVESNGQWTDMELDEKKFKAAFGSFSPGPDSRHGT